VVVLTVVFAAVAVTWVRYDVRKQRSPLPPAELVVKPPEGTELPTRVSWINTASQFVPRAALIDPAGDPDAGAWSRMSFPAFVIEWADGRICWSTRGWMPLPRRQFGKPTERVLGADPVEPLIDVGAALDRARDRVAGIAFTHLHDDHVQGIESLCRTSARPIDAFLGAAQAEHPYYLTRGALAAVKTSPCLHVTQLPDQPAVDLPGFPGVSVIHAAGHTPGSQLIVAHLANRGARPIVIAGTSRTATTASRRTCRSRGGTVCSSCPRTRSASTKCGGICRISPGASVPPCSSRTTRPRSKRPASRHSTRHARSATKTR
jgi:glyoxylase-like metal-dependent hydrolase (beta-lactamase superfamily II)